VGGKRERSVVAVVVWERKENDERTTGHRSLYGETRQDPQKFRSMTPTVITSMLAKSKTKNHFIAN